MLNKLNQYLTIFREFIHSICKMAADQSQPECALILGNLLFPGEWRYCTSVEEVRALSIITPGIASNRTGVFSHRAIIWDSKDNGQ